MRIARSSASAATLTVTLALAAAACGGGSPPPAATTPAERQIAPSPPPVDTSAVPEPEGLVVIARIKDPDAVLKTAGGWANLPLPGSSELVRSLTDDAVGDAVDLSQPVDGAVTLAGGRGNPKPLYAFSVAVKSFDDAKTRLSARHKTSPAANGALVIEGIGRSEPIGRDDAEEELDDENGCILAHASSGARLVCGEPGAIEALTPYLTRTLPRQSFPSDVHVEMRFAPVRGPVSDLRAQLPILARGLLGSQSQAVRDIVDAAIGELADIVGDTNRIVIDGRVGDAGIDATMRAEYGSTKSVVAQLATSSANRAGPPPPSFWHLPQETDVAFFGKGAEAKIFERPRELLTNLLVETFTEGGMPEAERKTIKDLVGSRVLPLFVGPAVYAKGFDEAAVTKAMAARKAVKPDDLAAADEAERAVGTQMVGWHLLQVSEPIANVAPILKDWSALWARPGFKAWATKQVTAKRMARLRIAPLPSAVVLPKDTVHLEVTIPREDIEVAGATANAANAAKAAKGKKIARKPIVVHLFAIPDAGSTWLAFGLDGTLVAKKAAVALSSAPQTGTIGAAPGLEALREASKVNGAAVLTLRGLLVFTAIDKSRSPFDMLATLPHKGASPVLMTFTAEGPSGPVAGATASTVRVPRGVIEDAIRLAMTAH